MPETPQSATDDAEPHSVPAQVEIRTLAEVRERYSRLPTPTRSDR